MASGAFGDAATHRVRFEVGGQLPFEQRDLDDDDRFAMRRWIGSATSHLRLAERDVLVTSFEAETTDKRLRPGAPASALAEDFDRTFLQARAEWWRDAAIPWSAGVLHTRHDEDGRRIADPSADLRTRRREWSGCASSRRPSPAWSTTSSATASPPATNAASRASWHGTPAGSSPPRCR
jgi:hypothetical protein